MTGAHYPERSPFTRWWWFSEPIALEDVRFQLDWLKDNRFGGVEIAWLYPLPGRPEGQKWLSPEWSEIVAKTKRLAEERGLGCDFTFGSLWPFGGSRVGENDASRRYDGLSPQRLRISWESRDHPETFVLNHLDRGALSRYSERMGEALAPAMKGRPSGLFCDSWEVSPQGLWTDGFGESFRARFGYDIEPLMAELDAHPRERYDYRKHLSRAVLDAFYRPFSKEAEKLGGFSRVQCHGAPTDLVAAYAAAHVPESEAILFDPHFSRFAASGAAISGAATVSCEAFTCLYGWLPYPGPGPHQGREQIADLKLLADGLLANGVNLFFWHGMPFNGKGGTNRFYASVHVGPDAGFADHLPAFNAYLEEASRFASQGEPFAGAAAYLPLEDSWMRHELPDELRRPSSHYFWELQEQRVPEYLRGYAPLWVSLETLKRAECRDGRLRCGGLDAPFLSVDVEWLDEDALVEILRLAKAGLPVHLARKPAMPGRGGDEKSFDRNLAALSALPDVTPELAAAAGGPPLVEGDDPPEFWARRRDGGLAIFFAHPMTKALRYPMRYGQSSCQKTVSWSGTLNEPDGRADLALRFAPHSAIPVVTDGKGRAEQRPIDYQPPRPVLS